MATCNFVHLAYCILRRQKFVGLFEFYARSILIHSCIHLIVRLFADTINHVFYGSVVHLSIRLLIHLHIRYHYFCSILNMLDASCDHIKLFICIIVGFTDLHRSNRRVDTGFTGTGIYLPEWLNR